MTSRVLSRSAERTREKRTVAATIIDGNGMCVCGVRLSGGDSYLIDSRVSTPTDNWFPFVVALRVFRQRHTLVTKIFSRRFIRRRPLSIVLTPKRSPHYRYVLAVVDRRKLRKVRSDNREITGAQRRVPIPKYSKRHSVTSNVHV